MTRKAQVAIVILAAMLVVLSAVYVRLALDAADADEREECVTAYRGEWQDAVGDIVLAAARDLPLTRPQVNKLARAQRHGLDVNDRCDPTQSGGPRYPLGYEP
jgi:hypothetical protein